MISVADAVAIADMLVTTGRAVPPKIWVGKAKQTDGAYWGGAQAGI